MNTQFRVYANLFAFHGECDMIIMKYYVIR